MTRDASIARLRVVLDASGKMRDDTSLSDHLLIGAQLQRILPFTTIRWRPWRSVHTATISGMFLQNLVDPAISMDAASTEKVAAETRQLIVLYLDCIDNELSHRYSIWIQLVRIIIYVRQSLEGNLKRQRPFQAAIIVIRFNIERGRVIWVPARLTTLFSTVVECVDEKRISLEVHRVNSVERYYKSRFINPPWRAVVRHKLCQLLRWQLVQAMQERIWRSWSKDFLHALQNRGKSHNRMHGIMAWLLSNVCCSPL